MADVAVKALHAEVAWDAVDPRPTKGVLKETRGKREVVHHHNAGGSILKVIEKWHLSNLKNKSAVEIFMSIMYTIKINQYPNVGTEILFCNSVYALFVVTYSNWF